MPYLLRDDSYDEGDGVRSDLESLVNDVDQVVIQATGHTYNPQVRILYVVNGASDFSFLNFDHINIRKKKRNRI